MLKVHDLLFKGGDGAPAGPAVSERDELGAAREENRMLLCRTCGQPVTSIRDGIAMNGKQTHALFNPAGILFEVGCFAQAPGCSFQGVFTDEFTWFPGYSWRYAFCRQCGVHLGWQYRGQVDGFIGLIMGELKES